MRKLLFSSFLLLFFAAELSAHENIMLSGNQQQLQIFFSSVGMLTCLWCSIKLLLKIPATNKQKRSVLPPMYPPESESNLSYMIKYLNHRTKKSLTGNTSHTHFLK